MTSITRYTVFALLLAVSSLYAVRAISQNAPSSRGRNALPVAVAGDGRTAQVGKVARLDGSGSWDADGNPLQFAWTLISRPAGSAAALADATAVVSRFIPDLPGTYVAQLVVHDGIGASQPQSVTVSTVNSAPVADAGPDQSVAVGAVVQLNGRRSTDADGDLLSYQWAFVSRPAGSTAFLDDAAAVLPTFIADRPGTYALRLVVKDAVNAGSPALTVITTGNSVPVASAGQRQSAAVGALVLLDGGESIDADGDPLRFRWSLTSRPLGSRAVLDGALNQRPSLTADRAGVYVAQLIVNDGYSDSIPATVTISTMNLPPVARAGDDRDDVEPGSEIGLFGGLSTDPERDPLSFGWTLLARPAGSTASLNSSDLRPSFTPDVEGDYVAQLIVSDGAGTSAPDTVLIRAIGDERRPTPVSIAAVDAAASESGPDAGTFSFTRKRAGRKPLVVQYSVGGTATNGTDYTPALTGTVTIPAKQTSATVTITPVDDAQIEPSETVVLTLTPAAAEYTAEDTSATVTISDNDVAVVTVATPDNTGSETGPDPAGFRFTRSGPTTTALTVAFTIGGTAGNGVDYAPLADSVLIPEGQSSADLIITPLSDSLVEGAETVSIALVDSGAYDVGTPSSGLVSIADAAPQCVSEGNPMVNGATHCGAITAPGQTDVWTFSATAGDLIGVHIGETIDTSDFSPSIRVIAPDGVQRGVTSGLEAASLATSAFVSGTYQVFVNSADSGNDGIGGYRLTMVHSGAPVTIDDPGGPLVNGAMHHGDIFQGDLDIWTFDAAAGDLIAVNIGQTAETDAFEPTIRIWAPDGVQRGVGSGTDAAVINTSAFVSGTYLVLVSSSDSGVDGEGAYRLTMTHSPGPITVSPGDQGGPLSNGGNHTGEILQGDLDVWTFDATAGDLIDVHIAKTGDTDAFEPWIRIWAPDGAQRGSVSGAEAAMISTSASVTGRYLVLVGSADSGSDGQGTYRLTMTHTPGPIVVSDDDQGGPLTNGGTHLGEIVKGDLDVWTFDATAGDLIGVNIGQTGETDTFDPWIRIWAPDGAQRGSVSGAEAAMISTSASVTGRYLVLVGSADSGSDGQGTYRLTMTHTPGPIVVSDDDQGGPLTNGGTHLGEIVKGDLDVWTFQATAGDLIAVNIGQTGETDTFEPWIRVWAPDGVQRGSVSGAEAASISTSAFVSGTYLVLVGSVDSGFDGTGTYRLEMAHTPGPVSPSAGDEGGALQNGVPTTGEIVKGDMDSWSFTAAAGESITINIQQLTETSEFVPTIRVWAPDGVQRGVASGADTATINTTAFVSGTYLVIVSSSDSGVDGTGTYRLTATHQ